VIVQFLSNNQVSCNISLQSLGLFFVIIQTKMRWCPSKTNPVV